MVGWGKLWRLAESNGRNKAAIGELTPLEIKPPVIGLKAMWLKDKDEIWWVNAEIYNAQE